MFGLIGRCNCRVLPPKAKFAGDFDEGIDGLGSAYTHAGSIGMPADPATFARLKTWGRMQLLDARNKLAAAEKKIAELQAGQR